MGKEGAGRKFVFNKYFSELMLSSDPCQLTLRIREGLLCHDFATFCFGDMPAEVLTDGGVADGSGGGGCFPFWNGEKSGHFLFPVGLPHGIESGADFLLEVDPLGNQGDGGCIGQEGDGGVLVPGGQLAAGLAPDGEGADDADGVLEIGGGGPSGIDGLDFCLQLRQIECFEICADDGVGRGRVDQSLAEGAEVESGASDPDQAAIIFLCLGNDGGGVFEVIADREGIGGIDEIEQVMSNSGLIFEGRFGGADIETAIDLEGIETTNVPRKFFREGKGEG